MVDERSLTIVCAVAAARLVVIFQVPYEEDVYLLEFDEALGEVYCSRAEAVEIVSAIKDAARELERPLEVRGEFGEPAQDRVT